MPFRPFPGLVCVLRKARYIPKLLQLVAPRIDYSKDLHTVSAGIDPKVDQKVPAQKPSDALRMPRFFFDQRCTLRQNMERCHCLFKGREKGGCGVRLQQLVGDVMHDGAELLFRLRSKLDKIFFHGLNLRAEPGEGFVQRRRLAALGLVEAGLHHGVKFAAGHGVAGGKFCG